LHAAGKQFLAALFYRLRLPPAIGTVWPPPFALITLAQGGVNGQFIGRMAKKLL
jgi:hypothetical protein